MVMLSTMGGDGGPLPQADGFGRFFGTLAFAASQAELLSERHGIHLFSLIHSIHFFSLITGRLTGWRATGPGLLVRFACPAQIQAANAIAPAGSTTWF